MKIKEAFNSMTTKEFVDWALKNNYDYFLKISGNYEEGWIWSKSKRPKQYKFGHKIN